MPTMKKKLASHAKIKAPDNGGPEEPLLPLTKELRARAKAMFKRLLRDQPKKMFPGKMSIWVEQMHPDWKSGTVWDFGQTLSEAKAIASLLPAAHCRKTVLRYQGQCQPLAYVCELSPFSLMLLTAWQDSGRRLDEKEILERLYRMHIPPQK